ncbi:NACHT, LRR and PYD domains-containing protein 12-like [Narcine bancroftii]|uniref:NACHT, LRR and PYD domains-containing protein 12-like n=1 Tax=Narcine bancroftii TaxID=1343680 RepID=UPI0038318D2A
MAEGADWNGNQNPGTGSREEVLPTRASLHKGSEPKSAINELLNQWNDYQLFQLAKFYQERLKPAIEEGVEGLSLILRQEGHFSQQEHEKVRELAENGNREDCSRLLFSLVMGKGSLARRAMWQSFVKLRNEVPKLDKILKEIQELGPDPHEYICFGELTTLLKVVQQKHRETLRAQTEMLRVNTILKREKVRVFRLEDQYAELTVISAVRDRRLVEHELLVRGRDHEEWREKHLQRELEVIQTDQLFQSSFSRSKFKSGSSAAVAGVPGIGKTTMVQKIVYEWATRKIFQYFQFVFSFKFRDMNSMNCRISLRELILDQYPYFENILGEVFKSPQGLLFIFDGLDEFKYQINFEESWRETEPEHSCTDPQFQCEVSDIVYSLIQHKLLPGCSILVTTRPTALHLLEKAEISVWAEILGFAGKERKQYFERFFEDQMVAAAVFKHVEENAILYTMSYNPSYCWILSQALGPFFTQRDQSLRGVPKTITQLYSYYIYNILQNHCRKSKSPRGVLLRLGQMAFTGVSKKNIVFTDGDLLQYDLLPSQFLTSFLVELLEREDTALSVVYTFPHLTIQEFVAALALFLAPNRKDIRKLLSEANSVTDGRFEVFLRFVAGLSSPGSAWRLEEFLGPFPREVTYCVIDWVKEEIRRQVGNSGSSAGKRNLLNALHYLFESQNTGLAQATLGSVQTLSFRGLPLTLIDCVVLSHVIGLCNTIKQLDLDDCCVQHEGLERLAPELHRCQELRLGSSNLGNLGVELMSVVLKHPDCKIQKLWMDNVGLTDFGTEDLASTLSRNCSLTELDLSGNNLRESRVKLVSAALRNPGCKIQTLRVSDTNIPNLSTKDVTSGLSMNHSLTKIKLSKNKLGDSGVRLLSEVLRVTKYKIQRLWLNKAGLTDPSAEDLISTLCAIPSLTELDLSVNHVGDSGAKLLSAALRNPDCKMQKLGLNSTGLTDSCTEDLYDALSTNQSLTDLNLSDNNLGDSGVKRISAALRNPDCKIQKLGMNNVGLTDSGTEDFALALGANRSLTEVYLEENKMGDLGMKLVSAALRNQDCKIQILWVNKARLSDCLTMDLSLSTNLLLKEISLNKLGDLGVKLVSAALRDTSYKIQKLELNNISLTATGAEDLASALAALPSLTELNLGTNELRDMEVKLASAVLSNPECKLQKLWLRYNGLSDSGAKELALGLGTNHSLMQLDLSDSKLGESGVKRMSAVLRNTNSQIQKLRLNNIGLTDACTEALASALNTNHLLTNVDLSSNAFTDQSVPVLRSLILALPRLEQIGLSENQFSSDGVDKLRSLRGFRLGLYVSL